MNYTDNDFISQPSGLHFEVGDHIDHKFLHATIVGIKKTKEHGTVYECECDKCFSVFDRFKNQIDRGTGCGVCSGRVLVKGKNDIPTTAPWMVKYFQGGESEASNYTKSCRKPFRPICPFCGRVSDKDTTPNQLGRLHGISCLCKDGVTMPNKMIRGLMEQALSLNMILSYEKEYLEYDERGIQRRFDMKFYDLNNNPYFVEMDGGRHGNIKREHSNKEFVFLPAKLFVSDLMKDNIAKKLNIPLIRIDCYKSNVDYIKENIYKSDLANILDLDKIDWLQLEDICFSSLMVDICNYKNAFPQAFASDVAKMFNISAPSVRDYWKRGTKLGLCNYDPIAEAHRSNIRHKDFYQSVGVYVENLDTNENWAFKTKSEFCSKSQEILDGDIITKSKIEKIFKKENKDYLFYDTGEHDFLIWLSRRK